MTSNWSLNNRLTITLAVFGGLVSLVLATIIYIASQDLEERLIDDTLTAELDDYVARRQRNPKSLPEKTTTIQAYVVTAQSDTTYIPDAVINLQPGQHRITINEISYRASMRIVGDQRYVVLYNTSTLKQREAGFRMLLSISVLLVTLISALAGRLLAARVIAPVNELALRVSELNPEDEHTPLAEEFPWIEVRRLAEDFDVYLQRLHDFIERERLFTGDVSHELRTPLAVISGATGLMLADANIDEANRKRIMRIARATNEISEITAALLALAREQDYASSHSIECDVESVARELIARYKEIFKHKPITVQLHVHKKLLARMDHAILSMVLGNLLRNAFSFTEQGEIIVSIDEHSIRVEDSGSGLGTQNKDELFQPYARGNHSNSGSGLGLSLVWRLCKRNGWKIELHDRPEGGTHAQLWLTQDIKDKASS
ncbi:MAG: HAMP domain-containing sensor histidine kinase [Woeseiaceae bacterium]